MCYSLEIQRRIRKAASEPQWSQKEGRCIQTITVGITKAVRGCVGEAGSRAEASELCLGEFGEVFTQGVEQHSGRGNRMFKGSEKGESLTYPRG